MYNGRVTYLHFYFQVVACHGFDSTLGKTRCSKRTITTATTKSDPELDFINSTTFNVTEVKVNVGIV